MEEDYTQIMLKNKLKLFDIFKQALTVLCKNYKFTIFTFFLSFPFFCFLLFFEIIFQRICVETSKFFEPHPYHSSYFTFHSFPKVVQLCLVNLIPYQLMELLNILIIVTKASRIYEAEKPISFRDVMTCKTRLKGPFITSLYVHLLSTITLFAFAGLNYSTKGKSFDYYVTSYFDVLVTMVDRVLSAAVLVIFLLWGSRWNMALVISMLDEKDGIEALEFSAQIILGRKWSLQWLVLMIVSFAWGFIIRISYIFIDENDELEVTRVLFTCCLSCIGNVMKWVICVVYYLDYKKGSLEKKDINV